MRKIILILQWVGLFSTSFVPVSYADILDHWTTNQISTNSYMHYIVYGNGVYVAVGEYIDGGEIYTSTDGFNWALQFSDLNSWGMTLNFSAGHFAGVSGIGIANVSADGTNWTSTFLPHFQYNGLGGQAVTYGNGLYVTVGDTNGVGDILTSPDGVTWTSQSITGGAGGHISDVVCGGLKFVAVGNNDGVVYTTGAFGKNWAKGSIAGGNKVSYANGLFLVPLNNKTNLLSVNGTTWSQIPTGLTNLMGKVTYSNSVYMAQCGISISGSHLATSIDGTNWVQYAKPLPNSWNTSFDLPDPDVSLATDGTHLVAIGATNYNSFAYLSDVLATVRMTNNSSHGVALSGLVGRNCQIQSANSLTGGANNWNTVLALKLTNNPYVWTDPTTTNSARFYRAVLLP